MRNEISTKNKSKKNKLALLVSCSLSICALSSPLSAVYAVENPVIQMEVKPADMQERDVKATGAKAPGVKATDVKQAETKQAETKQVQTDQKEPRQSEVAPREFARGEIYTKGLGLNAADLHLVNQGRFVDLVNKLAAKFSADKLDRNSAFLAFAYLYLQRCDDLNQLANYVESRSVSNVNLSLIQAFNFMCNKKIDLAEKEMQKIPAAAMNDAFVNYAFATLYGKKGQPQLAIAYTKRAVELAPDFAWGYRTIAFLQDKWLHQTNEAKTNYIKALEIEPKLTEASTALINMAITNNEYDRAIAIAKDAIASNPRKGANYCQLGDIYIQQWRFNEGAQQLRKAIALEPDNTQYYRQLAFILQKEGKLEEAIDVQKKAVNHSLDKSTDLVQLAGLQLEYGQKEQAVITLKQAIEANPENIAAISELTRLAIITGKFDDLLIELNKCANKFPKNELIKIRLGDAYTAAQQFDKAISAYKEAANLNSSDAEPHTKIAALLISKKDYEGAAKEYTRALNINPNSSANLVALGSCEAQMDDYLKAEAAFVTALALHQLTQSIDSTVPPTRVDIIRGLAALLYKEGRYADAASQFTAVVEMDKNPATQGLDKFMFAQAVALRDLSKDSFKQLDQAYNNFANEEKNNQKINYIDTLLRGKRYNEAFSLLTEMANAQDTNGLVVINSPFYWICFSQAYLGKNDLVNAEKAAQQAIDICEKDKSPKSDAYCQLGEVLFVKDDLAEAEKNANTALGINSRAFRAYVLLGNIAMKRISALSAESVNTGSTSAGSASAGSTSTGSTTSKATIIPQQTKLAIEAANKALEIDPYSIDAYLLLGKAQTTQGNYKGALTTYNKAVDLYPGLLQTHESLLAVINKIGTKEELGREKAAIETLKNKQ